MKKKNSGFDLISALGWAVRVFLIALFLPFLIVWLIVNRNKKDNEQDVSFFDMTQIESLDGNDFEKLLMNLFKNMGYKVELTAITGDFGADLLLEKKGKKSIVQAKRYGKSVGVRAVQEIISAREHYKIYDAYVVTNSYFSKPAIELSEDAGVFLINGEELCRLLRKYRVKVPQTQKNCTAMSDITLEKIKIKYPFWI